MLLCMPALPTARPGTLLVIKQRPTTFSFWPTDRDERRYYLSDYLFAKDPWAVIESSVRRRAMAARRVEAAAFVEQSRSFFSAAETRTLAATPLLLYYAFLNLAKALILASGHPTSLDQAMHGLSDKPSSGASELSGAGVIVKNRPGQISIFPLLCSALRCPTPAHDSEFPIMQLMPQVVIGHRLWREAGKRERFIDLKVIQFIQDRATGPGHVWARFHVAHGDLTRFNIGASQFLNQTGVAGLFHKCALSTKDELWYEQIHPIAFNHRASDELHRVVDVCRPILWRIVTTDPPYRRYYVHLTPGPTTYRLPQLLSLYALFFYFGSVTRYRPHVFQEILSSPYGPFIAEFVASQPEQLLYLLASEIAGREVAKPAII